MIAQFKQDLYNKNFTLHDQGKNDQIDTLEKTFWEMIFVTEDCIEVYDF